MRSVGVRDFRDHATAYLAGNESLAIERHGKTIGYYIPVDRSRPAPSRERLLAALDKMQAMAARIREETGLTEDELADLFDYKKPLPDPLPPLRRSPPSKLDAAGR